MSGKFVFIGASDTGWECCRALLAQGTACSGIVSMGRSFGISWSAQPVVNVRHRRFDDLAAAHGSPLLLTDGRWDADAERWLLEAAPDLVVVVGWYHMIPARIRSIAPLGAVGIHASLLPRYRGGAPLVWAMIRGESETGVTLFRLEDGVDCGDVAGQSRFPIGDSDLIADVVTRCSRHAVELVASRVPAILNREATFQAQDEASATEFPQRTPNDGRIDWPRMTAREAWNWIRAQSRPYPGAFTRLGKSLVRVWNAQLAGTIPGMAAGEMRCDADRILIAGSDSETLNLTDISIERSGQVDLHGFDATAWLSKSIPSLFPRVG